MGLRRGIENLIHLKNPGFGPRLALAPLALCSYGYAVAMQARAWLYKACVLESYAIPCRVIAVGNITVGGTGKTPTVCLLARGLEERGFRVCVVTRGYRGAATKEPLVVSDGSKVLATPAQAGDEAVMLGRKLSGIPVIACADRVAAGTVACERFSPDVVLLDDGFQHLRLRRDLDIVLIHSADPFGNGFVLPRGILREPLAALERAGIIVLTKTTSASDSAALTARVKKLNEEAPLFTASYRITGLRDRATGAVIAPEKLSQARVAALSSIGDPESFVAMIAAAGMTVAEKLLYPDHHSYCPQDYARIAQAAARLDAVVTTEKDIAKLDSGMLELKNIIVMEIEQVIEPADAFFNEVITGSGLR